MKIKKTIVFLLAISFVLVFSSCGESETVSSDETSSVESADFSSLTGSEESTPDTSSTAAESEEFSAPASDTRESSKASGSSRSSSKAVSNVNSTTVKPPTNTALDYTKYNLKTYMQPVWLGNTVYNEIVMFTPNAVTKQMDPAPLLYTPKEILSVRSYDLKTEYEEGRDYVIIDGKIALTESSRIGSWKYDEYYLTTPSSVSLPSIAASGRFLVFGNGATFAPKQVCVTYTHTDPWTGPVPRYYGDKLKNTAKLLAEKKPLKIVYNGDSISAGCESSAFCGIAPNMPMWTDLVTEELKTVTGAPITAVNTAVGGTNSIWGLSEVQQNIVQHHPDLVILGFGMNDGTGNLAPDAYQLNFERIIKAVRASNPDCEFLLVSTTLPNPDANGWVGMQAKYEANLEAIAAKTEGVAVAKMTEMHQHLMTKKRYLDMTGNNVNHPNDFLIRIQAQVISQALIKNVK